MQIELADNSILDGLQNVIALSSVSWENANRKGLQFSFSVDGHTTEEIKTVVTNLNKVKSFSIVNGEITTPYDHYIFLVDDSVELVTIENDDQRIEFTLARQTDLEIQVDGLVRDQIGNKIMMGVLESTTQSAIESLEV